MNGILLFNKEKDITSHNAINRVKKILNLDKVGHIGALDPNATGLLPILINKATKISDLLINHDKEYIALGVLGIKTDSYDITGNVIKEENISNIDMKLFNEILNSFKGNFNQKPPIYSAIKVKGKKLYEYARKNIEVEIKKREVNLYDINLLSSYYKDHKFYFEIKIHVSKGFYVRSLINDIGEKLNTPSTLVDLQRTRINNLKIEEAYTIDNIKNDQYKIITLEEYFIDYDKIIVSDYMEKLIINGVILDERQYTKNNVFTVYNKDNNLLAIYQPFENNTYKPVVIL